MAQQEAKRTHDSAPWTGTVVGRFLPALERVFGEGIPRSRLVGGLALLAAGFVLSAVRVDRYWSGRTAAIPWFQIAGLALAAFGFAVLPSPPLRRQRWWSGIYKCVCLCGALFNTVICAASAFLMPVAASLGSERWQGQAEALAAVHWSIAIALSWVVMFGGSVLFRVGRRWINLGWPTENPEQMTADLIIARDPVTAREVRIAEEDRYMHMLVVGPTGSGKTASGLSPGVIQDIRNPDVGLTIVEPKGDWINGDHGRPGVRQWAEYYGRKVFHIDPADPFTDVFNPLIGDRHVVAEVNSVALRVLFGQQDNFFANVQDALLKKTILLLKWLHGDNLTYWDIHKAVHNFHLLVSFAEELEKRLQHWEDHGFPPGLTPDDIMEAKDLVQWFQYETSGKRGEKLIEVTLGLRTQLDNVMNNVFLRRCIVPPPEPFRDENGNIIGGRVIDLDKHLAMGSILTVSTNDGLLAELSKVLGRMVITAFQFAASRRFLLPPEQRPPHFIWIDEAGTYLTPSWGEFQTKARGFRVGIVLAIQNLAQLETVQKGFSDVIVGQCRNRLIYGGLPPSDIRFWTNAFGTKDVTDISWSESQRAVPLTPVGDLFLFGPNSYNQYSSGRNMRILEKTKLSINEVLEQPRGRAVFQGVVGGNWCPPQIVAVDVVRHMPPRLRSSSDEPLYDPNAGVAVPKGPLLPPVPETVYAGTVTETVREKERRPSKTVARNSGSLASRVGLLPGQLQVPPAPTRMAASALSPVDEPAPADEELSASSAAGELPEDSDPLPPESTPPEVPLEEPPEDHGFDDDTVEPDAVQDAPPVLGEAPTQEVAADPAGETPTADAIADGALPAAADASDQTEVSVRSYSAADSALQTPPPVRSGASPADPVTQAAPVATVHPEVPTDAPSTETPGGAVVIRYGRSGNGRTVQQQVLPVAPSSSKPASAAKPKSKPPAPPVPHIQDITVQATFHGLERIRGEREEKKKSRYPDEPWE